MKRNLQSLFILHIISIIYSNNIYNMSKSYEPTILLNIHKKNLNNYKRDLNVLTKKIKKLKKDPASIKKIEELSMSKEILVSNQENTEREIKRLKELIKIQQTKVSNQENTEREIKKLKELIKIQQTKINSQNFGTDLMAFSTAGASDFFLSKILSSDSKFQPLHQAVRSVKYLQGIATISYLLPETYSSFIWTISKNSTWNERDDVQQFKAGLTLFAGETANALLLQYLAKQWNEKKENNKLIGKLDHEFQKLPGPIRYLAHLLTIRGLYILEKSMINTFFEKTDQKN